jgi:hypothetical protein
MVPDFRDGANMQYTVNYDEELDYIFVRIQGELSLVTLQDIAMDVAKLVQKTNCHRILNDLRQATPVTGAVEIYNMPGTARQAGVVQWCRRALVVGDKIGKFRFLETVFINQGHIVKVFTDFDEAQNWLCETDESLG